MRAAFKDKCIRIGCSIHQMGTFYMLNVFLNVDDELGGVINNNFIDFSTGVDKELLEELGVFLKLFDQAIDQLSDEKRPTMHKVLPLR
jgi:hypothetical protein